jgi:hypothetical protein
MLTTRQHPLDPPHNPSQAAGRTSGQSGIRHFRFNQDGDLLASGALVLSLGHESFDLWCNSLGHLFFWDTRDLREAHAVG